VLPPEIAQYFVPIRSSQPTNPNLVYEPRLLASASIHFLDGRRKIDESRDLTILVPLTNEATPVEWDDVMIADLSPDDLDVTPEEGGIFEELPAPANRAKNYKKKAHLQSEWVIMDCFSYGFEHTGQDFQAKIFLIA